MKIIRLTESDLSRIVRRVIQESSEYEFKTKEDNLGIKLSMMKNRKQIAKLYLLNLKDGTKIDRDLIPLLKIESKKNFNPLNSIFMHSIEVSPLYRGKGLSIEIMEEGFNLAKKMNYNNILAIVDSDNVVSLNLHRRLGYEIGEEYNNCHLVWKKI